ncbi:hypothetical protein [Mesorhizobium australicum]|uniref:hypothetical protein n=1 Tax=Mesorhizobium australicum TaxID=536018 RepID=UPI003EBCE23C
MPYPFLDVTRNGVESVAVAALAITILFLVICVVAVFVDHAIGRLGSKDAR